MTWFFLLGLVFCADASAVDFPDNYGRLVVVLDAGHGSPTAGTDGNVSVRCEAEMDHTFRVTQRLKAAMEATGHFRVLETRPAGTRIGLSERHEVAEQADADLLLSIHSDWRGGGTKVADAYDGRPCMHSEEDPGFSVLYSGQGEEPLRGRRLDLARVIAQQMVARDFEPYDGEKYYNYYTADKVDGVFRDGRGLLLLRRPTMPSVIIETHHALDTDDVALWQQAATVDKFVDAVLTALATLPRS